MTENMFLSRKDFNLDNWNPRAEIGLVDAPCGMGKTHFAVNGLPSLINERFGYDIKPSEVVFLVPLRAIAEQISQEHAAKVTPLQDFGGWQHPWDGMRIATYAWASAHLQELDSMRLIVCDEFHTLWGMSLYASCMRAIKQWVSSRTDAVRIAMTATPYFLDYTPERLQDRLATLLEGTTRNKALALGASQFPMSFSRITKRLKPKYRFNSITIVSGAQEETLAKKFWGTSDSKTVLIGSSARHMVSLHALDEEHSQVFISEGNTKEDKGGRYVDRMKEEERQYLIHEKKLPSHISTLLATSAAEAGFDLRDSAVKNLVVSSYLPHEIVQRLNRFRQSGIAVTVVVPAYMFDATKREADSAIQFLRKLDSAPEDARQTLLEAQYESQKSDEPSRITAPLVYREDAKYEVDYSLFIQWLYVYDSFFAATNHGKEATFCGESIPLREDYFTSMLADCSDSISFARMQPDDSNAVRVCFVSRTLPNLFKRIDSYVGKPLFKEDKAELVEMIKPIARNGSTTKPAKLASAYRVLEESGRYRVYRSLRGYFDGKQRRYDLIEREQDRLATIPNR